MKNKSTILIMALAILTAFVGCKKNEIDIETQLKELSEETFQSLEYCSHVNVNGYNMDVIQLHFNHADNTVEKTSFTFGDGIPAAYESKTYSFEWDEFTGSMLGRKARLVAGDDVLQLLYLNKVFTLSDTVPMTEAEALADIASSTSSNISNSDWAAYDPVYVMQDHWTMDTTWYITQRQGKKIIVDTITGRFKHEEQLPVGVASQKISYLRFYDDAATHRKTLAWSKGEQVNIVTPDTLILPQVQDATKNDTIITFSIEEQPASRTLADTASHWSLAQVKDGSFDVIYKLTDAGADETLQMSAYTDSTFTLDNTIYHNLKK
ncbi:MAG: hypothetical protein IJT12_06570 [Paludibacteraceae bacterium]|nr:hypothetical protein [Paludibacteraceae bacterium]